MYIIKLLNIQQWPKNLLIFAPAFFSARNWDQSLVLHLLIIFFGFSILSSAVYLINDLKDLEADKKHPKKKNRLIASGQLSTSNALISIAVFLGVSFSLLVITNNVCLLMGCLYFLTNLSYSFYLKRFPVIDLAMLSFGYIIRLIIGGEIAYVPISNWLFSLVVSIAIYIILFKRHSDVELNDTSNRTRFYASIHLNNVLQFLLAFILIIYASYILVVYIHDSAFIYAISTIPFTVFAAIRFHKGMLKHPHQDPLKIMVNDPVFLIVCICWTILFGITLY